MSNQSLNELKPLYPFIIISALVITTWLITVSILEYLLTEYWYIYDRISSDFRTWLLIVLVFAGNFFIQKIKPDTKTLTTTIIIFIISLGLVKVYQGYYSQLQRTPKIRSISKTWTIQADRITIEGRNFGNEHNRGSVRVGDLEFNKVAWNSNRLVLEQPIPDNFFTAPMYLTNHHDITIMVTQEFNIKDPSEVL